MHATTTEAQGGLPCRKECGQMPSFPEDRHQFDVTPIDHNLSGMFEIHRDAAADVGLHLSKPPVRLHRMSDQHPRLQQRIHVTSLPDAGSR